MNETEQQGEVVEIDPEILSEIDPDMAPSIVASPEVRARITDLNKTIEAAAKALAALAAALMRLGVARPDATQAAGTAFDRVFFRASEELDKLVG